MAGMRSLRARSTLLLAAAAWTIWVWATRIWNILGDPAHGAAFKAVHTVLALVSIAFAVALGVVGLRMRREAREIETAGRAG
jgi:small neutral amino acid transporter SnatA (MarC family)